jgi:ATP-binding protein involved in chromosome partitioning
MIENMSFFICPGCGQRHEIFNTGDAESRALAMGLPFLGAIPLQPEVRAGGDAGRPIVADRPDSDAARTFREIAGRLAQRISIHAAETEPVGAEHGGS